MSSTPKVSLVTVVRNGAAHIEKCISSVLNQTYPGIEYIIIDGGSTDGTLAITDKYRNRIATIISEPDNGIADAFNKGLKLANGEITGLLNADDWLEPDAIMNVVNEIGNNDILYGNMRQWTPGGTQYILTGDHTQLLKGMTLNHPSVFIRKRVYETLGYYNTSYKLAMDYELLLRCFLKGATFKNSGKLLTNMKTEGASDRNWLAALKEVKRAKDELTGRTFANKSTHLMAVIKTAASRFLLSSKLEPLFSYYRKHSKNIVKQQE